MERPNIQELTLREKIGQMGVYSETQCLRYVMENDKDAGLIGGIWVRGGANVKIIEAGFEPTGEKASAGDNWEFINHLNKTMKIPTIGCMDAEKGIMAQFHDMSLIVNSNTIGSAGSEELAYKVGEAKAKELKYAGSLWLWGPVVDLPTRAAQIYLGRSYSEDPDLVIKMAKAEVAGIQANGVAATAKHFPGGDEIEYRDSHTSESIMKLPMDKWKARQGRIFQEVIDSGVYSVMIGHAAFPACDNTKIKGKYIPSTVSHKVVTELLKEEMGFSGVVITDAIGMQGLAAMYDNDETKVAIACIKAGCDVILAVPKDFIDAVEDAVKRGEISESRIDDACERILTMKEKLGMFSHPLEEMDHDKVLEETAKVNQEVASKALSLICDNRKMLPLDPEKYKKVAIIYSGYSEYVYESLKFMKDEFEKHGMTKVHIQKDLADREEANVLPHEYDLMLYVAHVSCGQPHGIAGFQLERYYTFYHNGLGDQMEKRLGVSLGSPYLYFDYYSGYDCFVNAYSETEAVQRAFVKALYGEIPFEGGEPFRVIPEGFEVNY